MRKVRKHQDKIVEFLFFKGPAKSPKIAKGIKYNLGNTFKLIQDLEKKKIIKRGKHGWSFGGVPNVIDDPARFRLLIHYITPKVLKADGDRKLGGINFRLRKSDEAWEKEIINLVYEAKESRTLNKDERSKVLCALPVFFNKKLDGKFKSLESVRPDYLRIASVILQREIKD